MFSYIIICRYIAFLNLDEILLPSSNEPITAMIRRAMTSHPQAGAFLFKTSFHWSDKQPIVPQLSHLLSDVDDDVELKQTRLLDFRMQKNVFGSEAELKDPKSVVSTDRVITMGFHEIEDVADSSFASVLLDEADFGVVHAFKGVCQTRYNFVDCDRMSKTMQKREEIQRHKHEVVKNVDKAEKHLRFM